ncbi:hypothetical protein ColLi_06877 [Colletotrichum liriopes]|uniref:Uncharacterized protein n=1 Tax=Colletotrichum liriopes TaxID=708192 RepID=A0AA37LT88_9PEZI|nr:hypothetical protein ColLi_06877 [Colletotrichum liriopes]
MFRKLGAAGRKAAQADINAKESKGGHKVEESDVDAEMKKEDTDAECKKNEDRHEIDDCLDYIEVKLEDLELEDKKHSTLPPKMEESNVPKSGKKSGIPGVKPTNNKSDVTEVKTESTAFETKTNITPEAKDDATPKTKGKKTKAEDAVDFFSQWDEYFGKRELADWQRLCRDLGLPDDLPSKTQCRKALEKVHVNIKQFLDAMEGGGEIKFFKSVRQLARYTRKKRLWMPKKNLPKGDPLGKLRREINKYF